MRWTSSGPSRNVEDRRGQKPTYRRGGTLGCGGIILIFVVFYFLLIRPQQKRQKETQRMLEAIGKGDRVGLLLMNSMEFFESFLAIAKGDVPQEHWFRLGRALTETSGGRALLSWSASMFEYLMPLLVMRRWPRTILDETYMAVVRRQMQYAKERGVPCWSKERWAS